MHCVKLLGQRLMARDFDRQVAEFQVRIAVLNGFTALGLSFGYAECGEAVQDGDTDLELGDLTVEVPRHEALAQQFRFADLRFTQCIHSPGKRSPGPFSGPTRLISRRDSGGG